MYFSSIRQYPESNIKAFEYKKKKLLLFLTLFEYIITCVFCNVLDFSKGKIAYNFFENICEALHSPDKRLEQDCEDKLISILVLFIISFFAYDLLKSSLANQDTHMEFDPMEFYIYIYIYMCVCVCVTVVATLNKSVCISVTFGFFV